MLTDQMRGRLLRLAVIALLMITVVGGLLIASGVTRPDGGRAFVAAALPLTLPQSVVRVEAVFAASAPWGVQIGDYAIVLHPDGYISISTGEPRWLEFPHVRRGNNALLLIADADGMTVFVNDERVTWLPPLTSGTLTGIDLPTGAIITQQPP